MKQKTILQKSYGSDDKKLDEKLIVINKVLSTAAKLLKISLEDPTPENTRIAKNNLHTLSWVLDQVETMDENKNKNQYMAVTFYIDGIANFADRVYKENHLRSERHYLGLIKDMGVKNVHG